MKSRAGGIRGNGNCRAEFLYLLDIYSDRGEAEARGCCPILATRPRSRPGVMKVMMNTCSVLASDWSRLIT